MENLDNQYQLKQNIGSGSVYIAYDTKNNDLVAAKIFNTLNDDTDIINQINQEIAITSQINNPLFLRYLKSGKIVHENVEKYVMLTELHRNGSLRDILNLNPKLQEKYGWNDTKKLISIYVLAAAMSYLHGMNIIHHDFKPENILMDKYLHPIICDFGQAKKTDSMTLKLSEYIGSPQYIAPEILLGEEKVYTNAIDVYAFGIILYEIIVNKPPYDHKKNMYTIINNVKIGKRPEIPSDIPTDYKYLIEKCWAKDPSERFTFNEIIEYLKSKDFLKDQNDKKDFEVCVKYIDQFVANYDPTNKIMPIESFIHHETINFKPIELNKYRIEISGDEYYQMGYNYAYNDNKIDKEKAAECFRNAAQKGNVDAMYELGKMLEKGDGIKKDIKDAFIYLKNAAFKGNSDAMYECWILSTSNEDLNISNKESFNYLQMTARGGNTEAMYYYAMRLYAENDSETNKQNALIYLKTSADDDNIKSMLKYADIMYELDNKKEAFEYYKKAADKGNEYAILCVVQMLQNGDGVPRDLKEANYYKELVNPPNETKEWYILDSLDDFQMFDEPIKNNYIRKGKVRSTEQLVVAKLVCGNSVEKLQNECNNLLKCSHPSIQKVVGLYTPKEQNATALLTYYYPNSLDDFIIDQLNKNTNLNVNQIIDEKNSLYNTQYQILYGICDAMNYLEKNNMFHGNLNPSNILINDKEYPILNNIQMKNKYTNEELNNPELFINYLAPEVILGNEATIKSDVFSFGLIINELFSGITPHSSASSRKEIIENIKKIPVISEKIPNFLITIVKNCLKMDPNERYSFTQIIEILNEKFNFEDSPIIEYKKEINGQIQCPITFFRAPKILVYPTKEEDNNEIIPPNLLAFENLENILSKVSYDRNIKIIMVCGQYQRGKSTYLRTLTGNGGFFTGEGLKTTTTGILIDGPYNGNDIINRIGNNEFKMLSDSEELSFTDNPAIFFIDSQGTGDEKFEKISPIMSKYLSFFCTLSDLCINIALITENYNVLREFIKITRTGQMSKQKDIQSIEPDDDIIENDENIRQYDTNLLTKILFLIREYKKIGKKTINNKYQFKEITDSLRKDWDSIHKESNSKYYDNNIKVKPIGHVNYLQTYNYSVWNTIPDIVSILNNSSNHTKEYFQIKVEFAVRFLFSQFFEKFNQNFDNIKQQVSFIADSSLLLVNDTIEKYRQKKLAKDETIKLIKINFIAIKYIIIPFTLGKAFDISFHEYNQYLLDLMKDIKAYVEKNIPELKEHLFLNLKELILNDLFQNVGGGVAAGSVSIASTIGANIAKQVLVQIAEKVLPMLIPGGVIVTIISVVSSLISIGSFIGVFANNYIKTKEKIKQILTHQIPLSIPFLWEKANTNKKLINQMKSMKQINHKFQLCTKEIIIVFENPNSNFMKFIIQCMTGLETHYQEKSKNKKESIVYGPFEPNLLIQRSSRCFPDYKSNISKDLYILYLKGYSAKDYIEIQNVQKKALFFLTSIESINNYPTIKDKFIYMFSTMEKDENILFLRKQDCSDFQKQDHGYIVDESYHINYVPILMNDFNDFEKLGPLNNKCLRWSFNQMLQRKKNTKS